MSQWIGRLGAAAYSKLDLNFIKIHYLYFVLTSLISAGILCASNTDTLVDVRACLFLCGVSTIHQCTENLINLVSSERHD